MSLRVLQVNVSSLAEDALRLDLRHAPPIRAMDQRVGHIPFRNFTRRSSATWNGVAWPGCYPSPPFGILSQDKPLLIVVADGVQESSLIMPPHLRVTHKLVPPGPSFIRDGGSLQCLLHASKPWIGLWTLWSRVACLGGLGLFVPQLGPSRCYDPRGLAVDDWPAIASVPSLSPPPTWADTDPPCHLQSWVSFLGLQPIELPTAPATWVLPPTRLKLFDWLPRLLEVQVCHQATKLLPAAWGASPQGQAYLARATKDCWDVLLPRNLGARMAGACSRSTRAFSQRTLRAWQSQLA